MRMLLREEVCELSVKRAFWEQICLVGLFQMHQVPLGRCFKVELKLQKNTSMLIYCFRNVDVDELDG